LYINLSFLGIYKDIVTNGSPRVTYKGEARGEAINEIFSGRKYTTNKGPPTPYRIY
jgi:hypothetical protein